MENKIIGECQACGRFQKLVKGTLANHGYTLDHGFFNGTCMGSKHPPLEESNALIVECIDRAKSSIESIQNEIQSMENNSNEKIYFHLRDASTGKYNWSIVSIEFNENVLVVDSTNKKISMAVNCLYGKMEDVKKTLNDRRIAFLRKNIIGLQKYIEWQNSRLSL